MPFHKDTLHLQMKYTRNGNPITAKFVRDIFSQAIDILLHIGYLPFTSIEYKILSENNLLGKLHDVDVFCVSSKRKKSYSEHWAIEFAIAPVWYYHDLFKKGRLRAIKDFSIISVDNIDGGGDLLYYYLLDNGNIFFAIPSSINPVVFISERKALYQFLKKHEKI